MTKGDMRDELDAMIGYINEVLKTLNKHQERLKIMRLEMRNRPPIKRAPSASVPLSPVIRQSIIAMNVKYPKMTMSQIARAHKLNSEGRVSEILRGKRK